MKKIIIWMSLDEDWDFVYFIVIWGINNFYFLKYEIDWIYYYKFLGNKK